jgi:rod shape determining protein RodA
MFDRRLILNFDWALLVTTMILAGLGILNLYSATYPHPGGGTLYYLKQFYWLVFGLGIAALVLWIDYRVFLHYAYLFYGLGIILLVMVHFFGRTTSGSQRWLSLYFFSFQPSEMVKIGLIMVLARYFSEHENPERYSIQDLARPILSLIPAVFFILRQPDLGTVGVILLIFLSMLAYVGLQRKTWLLLGIGGAVLLPLSWFFLKEYQKNRLLVFLNPELDPLVTGYHITQSKIAVGSGTFWGKGFLKGTQSQLHFIPEQHTDFVFSVWAEEWGFWGSFGLLFLILLLISRGLKIAHTSKDRAGAILALGISAMLFWQTFINIGMVLGIIPVVGVPLPLLSYGGTSLIITLMEIALLMNISMRRFMLGH